MDQHSVSNEPVVFAYVYDVIGFHKANHSFCWICNLEVLAAGFFTPDVAHLVHHSIQMLELHQLRRDMVVDVRIHYRRYLLFGIPLNAHRTRPTVLVLVALPDRVCQFRTVGCVDDVIWRTPKRAIPQRNDDLLSARHNAIVLDPFFTVPQSIRRQDILDRLIPGLGKYLCSCCQAEVHHLCCASILLLIQYLSACVTRKFTGAPVHIEARTLKRSVRVTLQLIRGECGFDLSSGRISHEELIFVCRQGNVGRELQAYNAVLCVNTFRQALRLRNAEAVIRFKNHAHQILIPGNERQTSHFCSLIVSFHYTPPRAGHAD